MNFIRLICVCSIFQYNYFVMHINTNSKHISYLLFLNPKINSVRYSLPTQMCSTRLFIFTWYITSGVGLPNNKSYKITPTPFVESKTKFDFCGQTYFQNSFQSFEVNRIAFIQTAAYDQTTVLNTKVKFDNGPLPLSISKQRMVVLTFQVHKYS